MVAKRDYLFQVGLISSALEHAVPEQMFTHAQNPGEAISAVKALQKANAQGQRIYHITPANQASTLPHIHHSALVMDEIRNALNAGKASASSRSRTPTATPSPTAKTASSTAPDSASPSSATRRAASRKSPTHKAKRSATPTPARAIWPP
jgi:hypothetical protein